MFETAEGEAPFRRSFHQADRFEDAETVLAELVPARFAGADRHNQEFEEERGHERLASGRREAAFIDGAVEALRRPAPRRGREVDASFWDGRTPPEKPLPAGQALQIPVGFDPLRPQEDVVEDHAAAALVAVAFAGEDGKEIALNQSAEAGVAVRPDMAVKRAAVGDEGDLDEVVAVNRHTLHLPGLLDGERKVRADQLFFGKKIGGSHPDIPVPVLVN